MKAKQPTPFYELAESIANGETLKDDSYSAGDEYHVCNLLEGFNKDFFIELFKPEYAHASDVWMNTHKNVPYPEGTNLNNNHRIIALLFADLMWQDEHNTN